MQNLIVGKSGSGKGYEVCAFHILSALKQGRKVITNMPLVLEKWGAIDPGFPDLIEMRKRAMPIRGTWEPTREEGAFNLFSDPSQTIQPPVTARAFANVWDYYSTWRHPETGAGPLFVIDEAQNVIPRAKTSVEVEEWSALHRHFVADVLFMTQSYGKLSQAIRDNIQIVYRLTKKIAWGQPNKYIRKVQDGIRGEVLNSNERTYNPAYFGLWVSQTQGGSGEEFGALDVKPLWQHWTFRGAAIMFVLALGLAIKAYNHKSPTEVAATPKLENVVIHSDQSVAVPDSQPASLPPRGAAQKTHPFDGKTMHLSALIVGVRTVNGSASQYLSGYVSIEASGDVSRLISFSDLTTAGYEIRYESPSVISISYRGFDLGFVVTDLPNVSLAKTTAKQSPLTVGAESLAAGGLPLAGGTR
jgi:zona occludens toxin